MGNSIGDGNQIYQPEKFLRDNQTDKFTMNQGFLFSLIDGLDLRVNGSWYYSEGIYESFNKDYYTNPTTINAVGFFVLSLSLGLANLASWLHILQNSCYAEVTIEVLGT